MPNGLNFPASLDEALWLPLYVLALVVQVGIFSGTVYGIDINSTLVSLGGTTISWVVLVSEGCVLVAFALFEIDVAELNTVETVAAAVAALLPLVIAFVPALKNLVVYSQAGNWIGPTVAVLVGGVGMAAMTYVQETSDEFGFNLRG